MLNIDESTADGNIDILSNFQKVLGLTGEEQQSVVGDQATCKNIRAAKRRKTGEVHLVDSLKRTKENPRDFTLCGNAPGSCVRHTGRLKTFLDHLPTCYCRQKRLDKKCNNNNNKKT